MSARRVPRPLLLLVLPAMVGSVLALPPAHAAVPQPGGLSPTQQTVAGNPVLSWDRVPGATSYDVEVATNSDFLSPRYRVVTVNDQATPNVELPAGKVWWRVQANTTTGESGWSEGSFQRDDLAGPALVSPADHAVLDQPEDPALLSWEPVDGAVGYTIEIDNADDFISPKVYTTMNSSYVVPNPQIAETYHWRVRATLAGGVFTSYSDDRAYSISGLEKPVLVSPTDTALQSIEDVVLDWKPVVGAATYDLQISTDANFNTIEHSRAGVQGTRYSPPTTLDNDQYYWRVRPVDPFLNQLHWGAVDTWEFRRHWPDQPRLEHPGGGAVVGDPFFYQWTPVDKASHYAVEISKSGDFSAPDDVCTTVHTTYVPVKAGDCYPDAAGTYWWRVIGLDAYGGPVNARTDGIMSEVRRFSYLPDMVDLGTATPLDGATVQVPTLSWEPVEGAARYRVFLTAVDGGANGFANVETASTTYTPRKALTPGKTYRWWVQTVSVDGRLGPGLPAEAQSRFTVAALPAATASAPDPLTPVSETHLGRFPGMTWSAVAGAAHYRIGIRPAASIEAFTELPETFAYPAGDVTVAKSFGDYEWIVSAYDSMNTKLSVGSIRTVKLLMLPRANEPRAGITGLATTGDSSCTDVLPDRCQDLRQTPVLRWSPVPGAAGYKLYLSRDREMTNLVPGYPVLVPSSMWTPTNALIDSQAGDAFYWEVQPCVTSTWCDPVAHAEWAFNKRSNPVELISPAAGAVVADDVTFTWGDYLETNLDPGDVDAVDETGLPSRIEAREYRIEVSTVPNFQSLVDRIDVDQTTYTAFAKSYPEGKLYWRVSATDGTGNLLTSSPAREFIKSSTSPTLTSPVTLPQQATTVVSRTEPFRWDPMPFASRYDIEVYKNGDLIGQTANKVVVGSSQQAAYTSTTPLPASATPYTWRIRRVDATGNPGAWTGFSTFRVKGASPGLTAPAEGALVAGNDALFTWKKVAGATSYRFERRAAGSTWTAESVTTPALAWAPLATIADGEWQWRVTTLDAAGKDMDSSGWRPFVVDGTRPTVTSTTPLTTAARRANFVVTFSEPVTGVSTTTFRLYRKGVPDSVPAVVTVNAAGTKAVLNPVQRLQRRQTYIAKVTTGITDRAGNALPAVKWKVAVG